MQNLVITVLVSGLAVFMNFRCIESWFLNNETNKSCVFYFNIFAFLALVHLFSSLALDWCLVSGSYGYIQVSSPVITLLGNSGPIRLHQVNFHNMKFVLPFGPSKEFWWVFSISYGKLQNISQNVLDCFVWHSNTFWNISDSRSFIVCIFSTVSGNLSLAGIPCRSFLILIECNLQMLL